MRRGLFLDRDGVINRELGRYVSHADDFIIEEAVFSLLELAARRMWPVQVITNQGGVAKGLYDLSFVHSLHAGFDARCHALGLPAPDWWMCPHHPEVTRCLCRKPASLMFERALAVHRLDAGACVMIGDQVRDLTPAKALGMHTIMLGKSDAAADRRFDTLSDATEYLSEW